MIRSACWGFWAAARAARRDPQPHAASAPGAHGARSRCSRRAGPACFRPGRGRHPRPARQPLRAPRRRVFTRRPRDARTRRHATSDAVPEVGAGRAAGGSRCRSANCSAVAFAARAEVAGPPARLRWGPGPERPASLPFPQRPRPAAMEAPSAAPLPAEGGPPVAVAEVRCPGPGPLRLLEWKVAAGAAVRIGSVLAVCEAAASAPPIGAAPARAGSGGCVRAERRLRSERAGVVRELCAQPGQVVAPG